MQKEEILYRLNSVEQSIKKYKRFIEEIESSKRLKFFHSKDLKKFKNELESLLEQKTELLKIIESCDLKEMKIMIDRKNKACQFLIDRVLKTEIIVDETGKEIVVSQEIKSTFIEILKNFINSNSLSYVYNYVERDNYFISEELNFNSDGNIDLLIIINDYKIGSKQHCHYKTLDEMLLKYMLSFYENEKNYNKTI